MPAKHDAQEKRKWVRLTRACNNRCRFCLDDAAQDGAFVPVHEVLRELREGLAAGCRRAVLSGGEPTVHPDFVKIIALASKLGYAHVQAISNGRMFCYPDLLARARAAGLSEITFSLHGLTPEKNDRLVGARGAFAQTVAAISAAVRTPGLVVSSDIVVSAANVGDLGRIMGLLFDLGVREFDLLQVMPFGRAWDNWKELNYDPLRRRAALDRALAWAGVPGVHVWTNRFPPELFEGRERFMQDPGKLAYEVTGRRDMLRAFLDGRGRLDCRGARCRWCVLRGFCADLALLRERGRLEALPPAPCLGRPAPARRASVAASDSLEKIAAFYIRHRYAVKSARCRRCAAAAACAGADINFVRKNGFAALRPLRARGRAR